MSADTNKITTFEQVYRQQYVWLFHKALDRTLDEELAKDLVEEVFVDLWHKFDNIRLEEVLGLLSTLLRNKIANHYAHQQVEQRYEQEIRQTLSELAEDDDEAYEERLRLVGKLLDEQPAQRRFIFEECCLRGRSYKEMAEKMGVEVSTIHKHVSRVYAELRKGVKAPSGSPKAGRKPVKTNTSTKNK